MLSEKPSLPVLFSEGKKPGFQARTGWGNRTRLFQFFCAFSRRFEQFASKQKSRTYCLMQTIKEKDIKGGPYNGSEFQ